MQISPTRCCPADEGGAAADRARVEGSFLHAHEDASTGGSSRQGPRDEGGGPETLAEAIPGLFAAGRLIDVDAYTGGFNLQIAFSTGHAAADWRRLAMHDEEDYEHEQ